MTITLVLDKHEEQHLHQNTPSVGAIDALLEGNFKNY